MRPFIWKSNFLFESDLVDILEQHDALLFCHFPTLRLRENEWGKLFLSANFWIMKGRQASKICINAQCGKPFKLGSLY